MTSTTRYDDDHEQYRDDDGRGDDDFVSSDDIGKSVEERHDT